MADNKDFAIIELCYGTTYQGQAFHAFVEMTPDQHTAFKSKIEKGAPFDVGACGKILHTGWGKEPSREECLSVMRDHTQNDKIFELLEGARQ